MPTTDPISLYADALRDTYVACKSIRMDQLRGQRVSVFGRAGVHLPSYFWGQVKALERVEPDLYHLQATIEAIREAAEEDALADFLAHELRAVGAA